MAGGIPERRVRSIWDAIDSRQFKNALKISSSLLAKFPNSPHALALKALILEKMGKSDEALSVCLNAKELLYTNDSILIDDLTLMDVATSCYEYACGKFPNNLELMMGLFSCYVREYSFVKQQQIAIKMYKIVGEERFLLWAVCSIQLQVFCGNAGEKLLLLAEGLLKKHIASHSLHESEALIVYIAVLEQQSKFGDALEILTRKLGSLILLEVDKLRMQGRLLAEAGDYAAAANLFQKVLELWYKSLEVKSILLETVSHHILPQMLISPLWVDLNDCLRGYLKFMEDHLRESADLTFLAYHHQNYSKVIEFVQFKEQLQHSSQYLMAKIEAPILKLKQNADNIKEERVLENLKCGIQFLDSQVRLEVDLRPSMKICSYDLGPFEGVSYCPRESLQHQIKQMKADVSNAIERRSLLPRMIHLSIWCASSSLKENIEANGSVFDPKVSLELKILLEQYAKMLGFPFQDAIELVFGVSSGQKSSEALSANMIEWVNFAVFLNAWNLTSHELELADSDTCRPSTWHIVNSLLEKYILEKIRATGLLVSSPGCDLPILVQLVTEPLAWHGLTIQSCVRASLPSGKKKKKGGAAEQSNSELSQEIRASIQSLCGILEEVTKWLREQINRPVDGNLEVILSSLQRNEQNEGPGKVFQILETLISSMNDIEFGDRISKALKFWNPVDVAMKIVTGQRTMLSKFLHICELKVKALQSLKLHLQH